MEHRLEDAQLVLDLQIGHPVPRFQRHDVRFDEDERVLGPLDRFAGTLIAHEKLAV
jgi:hypothetical protein